MILSDTSYATWAPGPPRAEEQVKKLGGALSWMIENDFVSGQRVRESVGQLNDLTALTKVASLEPTATGLTIVADSILDLGFSQHNTKAGQEYEWVRERMPAGQRSKITREQVNEHIFKPMLCQHTGYEDLILSVQSGATTGDIYKTLKRIIGDSGHLPQDYPHDVAIMMNLNEMCVGKWDAAAGSTTYRSKNLDSWADSKWREYHEMAEYFKKIRNLVFIGPGNEELWQVSGFDENAQKIVEVLKESGHPFFRPDRHYADFPKSDEWHFKGHLLTMRKLACLVSSVARMMRMLSVLNSPAQVAILY